MSWTHRRLILSLSLLAIYALALGLRFYGMDWGFKDGAGSFHPDERHYESCAAVMNPQWLSEAEQQLPIHEQLELLFDRNLRTAGEYAPGTPGLRPVNYNYGTLPLHLYLAYKNYLIFNQESYQENLRSLQEENANGAYQGLLSQNHWILLNGLDALGWVVLLITLWIGLRQFAVFSRALRYDRSEPIPLYADYSRWLYLLAALAIPLAGLAITFGSPHLWVHLSQYSVETSSILLVGRMVTAWGGALTVLLVYLIGRDAYRPLAGLIGALMLATAMLHVQSSHFATVDVLLGFFATAAVYCLLKVSLTGRFYWYGLGALCIGLAVGAKWSGLMLIGLLWVAQAITTINRPPGRTVARWIHVFWLLISGLILAHFFDAARSVDPAFNITLAAFARFYQTNSIWLLAAAAFLFGISLYLLRLQMIWDGKRRGWLRAAWRVYSPWLYLVIALPIGVGAFFAAQPMAFYDSAAFARDLSIQSQYNASGSLPIWYTEQFNHTAPVFYSLDNLFYPSLDWLTAFFVIGGCLYALGRLAVGRNPADLFLCAWVFPAFILFSSVHSKFPRYLLIVLPVMMVLGGRFMAELWTLRTAWQDGRGRLTLRLWTRRLGYALGGLALLCGLFYGIAYAGIYHQPHTLVQAGAWLAPKAQAGAKIMVNNVDEGPSYGMDIGFHYAGPSNSNPESVAQYYANKLVQTDYLVFRSKRPYGTTLQNPDQYPYTNRMLRALFAEQLGFRVAKVISNPPTIGPWRLRADEEDETARIYDHPKVIILEKTQAYSTDALQRILMDPPTWVDEISKGEMLRLRDGYPVYASPDSLPVLRWWLALQAVSILAFILVFPLARALPGRGWEIAKPVGLALFGWLAWLLASTGIMPSTPLQHWLVFALIAAGAGGVLLRVRHEVGTFLRQHWRYLLALEVLFLVVWSLFLGIRAYHPGAIWGEKPMNFSFINAVYRADTFPPEDPWISGEVINYYYYGHAIYSLLGEWAGIEPSFLFNVGGSSVGAMAAMVIFGIVYALCRNGWLALLSVYLSILSSHLIAFLQLFREAGRVSGHGDALGQLMRWLGAALQTYLGFGNEQTQAVLHSMSYDSLFWLSRSVIPHTAANEYPLWTYLFLDFHAHMLVVPFTLAFAASLYAFFARPFREMGAAAGLGFAFLLALLLGTVTCTNTWDLPGLTIAFTLAVLLKFWRESPLVDPHTPRMPWLEPAALQAVVRQVVMPLAGVLLLSVALMYPFHHHFEARVGGVAWMVEGQTELRTYLLWWGPLLFALVGWVPFLAAFRPDGRFSLPRAGLFLLGLAASVGLAFLITLYPPFKANISQAPDALPLDYSVFGLFVPFLVVIFFALWNRQRPSNQVFALLIAFIGLGLSLGIELFYIKEGWSEPAHRWNTAFKFNLQSWYYLALFAPLALHFFTQHLQVIGMQAGKLFSLPIRFGYATVFFALVLATLPFTLLAPAMVTFTHGAYARDAKGPRPTLDGLAWMRSEAPSDYAAVHWFNRFVPNTPNIVEKPDGYYNYLSRFSTNTGLPAIMGWAHHVGERLHQDEKYPRTRDADRIYLSENREEVKQLLAEYRVEYLVFGTIEQNNSRQGVRYGNPSRERLMQWPGLLSLVYHNGPTSIFRVNRSLHPDQPAPQRESLRAPSIATGIDAQASLFEGGEGSAPGQFRQPRGITIDANGYIYIADTFNHRLQAFRPGGPFLWQLGGEGNQQGQFREPNAVDIDPGSGNIYVADTWNHRVILLDKFGNWIGATDLMLYGPRGLAFHPEERRLYIADTGNHMIKVLESGTLVDQWGEPGGGGGPEAFREPIGIEVTHEGNLAIADSLNRRVKIYQPDGELLRVFPIETEFPDGGMEIHLLCTADGRIALTDPREGSIHVYGPEGNLLGKLQESVDGQSFEQPAGIDQGPQGRILVTDIGRNQVFEIRLDALSQAEE